MTCVPQGPDLPLSPNSLRPFPHYFRINITNNTHTPLRPSKFLVPILLSATRNMRLAGWTITGPVSGELSYDSRSKTYQTPDQLCFPPGKARR